MFHTLPDRETFVVTTNPPTQLNFHPTCTETFHQSKSYIGVRP